jgi:hypothetical protein
MDVPDNVSGCGDERNGCAARVSTTHRSHARWLNVVEIEVKVPQCSALR